MPRIAFFSLVVLILLTIAGSATAGTVTLLADPSGIDSQTKESSLGDLVADALESGTGAPFAIIPAGSLKMVPIPEKSVFKADDILGMLQYPDDKIVKIELSTEQIIQILERSISVYPQKNLGFLQVAGVNFTFDPSLPKGSRITSITDGSRPLGSGRKYTVATTEPFAQGQYGYFTVLGKDLKINQTDKTLAQVLTKYFDNFSEAHYTSPNRIIMKGK